MKSIIKSVFILLFAHVFITTSSAAHKQAENQKRRLLSYGRVGQHAQQLPPMPRYQAISLELQQGYKCQDWNLFVDSAMDNKAMGKNACKQLCEQDERVRCCQWTKAANHGGGSSLGWRWQASEGYCYWWDTVSLVVAHDYPDSYHSGLRYKIAN
eukprot:98147_1